MVTDCVLTTTAAHPILGTGIQHSARVSQRRADMDHDDTTPRDLTCRELAEFVMDYLDEALSAGERTVFEAHLAVCEDCIAYLRSYREAVRLGKAYGQDDDRHAPEMPEDLVQAILASRRSDKV
jgi:anti-sigma factor RsiW